MLVDSRICLATALALCAVGVSPLARAADPPEASSSSPLATPGADQIQFAAREHDLGYRAYLDHQYDEAATHFENAFFAAPNPAELRSAIRARRDAGELARAATLAAVGQRRFASDAATQKTAEDTVAAARPHVHEISITSGAEYSVAVDEKIVMVDKVKDTRLFVDPGTHQLLVTWSDGRSTRVAIEAKAGGTQTLELEPPAAEPAPAPPPPPPVPLAPPPPPPPVIHLAPAPPPEPGKPLGPAVFITGAVLTTISAGFLVGAGIYTENNPGPNAVKTGCRGDTAAGCTLLQTGLAHQTLTNVLVGTTVGLGVGSAVIGAFFTQWTPTATAAGVSFRPVLGIGGGALAGTF